MFERRPSCSDTGVRGRAIGAPNANIGGGTAYWSTHLYLRRYAAQPGVHRPGLSAWRDLAKVASAFETVSHRDLFGRVAFRL